MIELIANGYGVKPIFVWQPVSMYKYDQNSHLFAKYGFGGHIHTAEGYRAMETRKSQSDLGQALLWCADIQEGVKQPLYIDLTHYSAPLSKSLADCIATLVKNRNLLAEMTGKTQPSSADRLGR